MLPANWHSVLSLFLLISPHVLLGVLAIVLYQRRLYRRLPCFFAYVLYEIAKFAPLFALYTIQGVSGKEYAYAYSISLLISIILRFGVIDEVSKDLFRGSNFLRVSARRALQFVTGLLIVVGVLIAVYAPGDHGAKWSASTFVVNRGAAMVQCGLLLTLLLFSRFLGLSWRRPSFGIALGLGVLTSVDLAHSALRAEFAGGVGAEFLNLVITGTYLVCVLIWIGYSLAPEAEPVTSLAILPKDNDEVETWNMELQHLLRD
jgi:hypothetical protein